MAKTKISEWSTTPASNTDIDGINIAEGCAPSGINDAIRDLMAQVRSWQSGASGDPFNGPMNGTIGATTAYSGAFTTVSATGVITSTLATGTAPLTIASTTKVTNLNADLLDGADWASPAALGSTTPAAVSATTLSASGTVSGTGFSNYLASPPAIGGTTAAAGSFTTLTTSSTVTLNGGTANGVTYLNGSKVLTSGSALTFDGTRLNVGGATNTYSGRFITLSDSTNGYAYATDNTVYQYLSAISGGVSYVGTGTNHPYAFSINGSEQMRLTSTGLGIGTSSPGAKLTVSDTTSAAATAIATFVGQGSYSMGIQSVTNSASTVGNRFNFNIGSGGGEFSWSNNGGTLAYLNSSGNLGIGTSSPNKTGYDVNAKVLTVYGPQRGAVEIGSDTPLSSNTLGALNFLSSTTVKAQVVCTLDGSSNGQLLFATNGSTRATIDSSGNLGLGVTPSAWGSNFKAIQVNDTGASLWSYRSGATSDEYLYLSNNSYNNNTNDIYIRDGAAVQYRQLSGTHAWFNAASGTAGTAISFTQAMTLDASGNLGVGTTSPSTKLHVVGINTGNRGQLCVQSDSAGNEARITLYDGADNIGEFGTSGTSVYAYSGGNLLLYAGGSERARIDSSGNLLVGTTTTNPHSSGTYGVQINKAVGLLIGVDNSHAIIAARWNANGEVIRLQRDNTDVGSIDVTTTATSYNTSSDYRLKENIAPMVGALTTVAQLKPCTYTWKVNGTSSQGFIAHELQAVVPECVTGEKDAVDEEGNPKYQGIDTSFLVATLTAAIQELKAEFDAYKASHP